MDVEEWRGCRVGWRMCGVGKVLMVVVLGGIQRIAGSVERIVIL